MDWITPQLDADRIGMLLGVDRNGNRWEDGPSTTPRRMATAAPAHLSYTPTPALKRQTVQAYANRLRPTNPAAAQAVATTFGPGKYDYGLLYQRLIQPSGLHANDAIDAVAVYMIINWMIVHNVQDAKAITVPMAQGVRRQVAPRLATNTQFRQRAAQLGEELKLQTILIQSGWQSAIKGGKLPAFQQRIAAQFQQQYGMDLRQRKLTSQGFAN